MKKITIEYESRQDYEYDEELRKKGLAFDEFDELLRQKLKYGEIDEMLKEYKEKMKREHNDFWPNEKFKFTAKGFLSFVLQDVRDELHAQLFDE